MIGLFMKIAFHAQLRSAEPKLAAELAAAVDQVVSGFAARRSATEESFLLTFEESSRPCRLRAAEAARSLGSSFSALGPRLHGWALFLDAGAQNAEEALLVAKRLWFGIPGDGIFISARSKAFFSDYFLFGPGLEDPGTGEPRCCYPVLDAKYARPALPLRDAIDELPSLAADRLVEVIKRQAAEGGDATALAVLGPGPGPSLCVASALSKLYPDSSSRFLRLEASAVERAPYGPLARAFAAQELAPGEGLLEELGPMLDFLRRSPFRRGCSAQFDLRLRRCAAAALGLYARRLREGGLPALIFLDRIEHFPKACLELVLDLVAGDLAGEALTIVVSGSELPLPWTGPSLRSIEVPGPNPRSLSQAALRCAEALREPGKATELALTAAGDPLRLRLALRVAASGSGLQSAAQSTEALAAQALSSLPREYAELLLALRLGEEILTDEAMEDFLKDSGYIPGIRRPIYESLAELGLISREKRPRILSGAAARGAESALDDGGEALRADFSKRLLRLREGGLILPSAALYKRMSADPLHSLGPGFEDSSLALDSILADLIYGASSEGGAESLDSPLAPLADFLAMGEAMDRDGSLVALEALEASVDGAGKNSELMAAVAALARAAFDYAEGRAQTAATRAKNALMGLHALGLRKAEARAHRILGLCSLAQAQVQEGADYLANAYEIASAQSEPLECILSATAEAAAHFTLGDLGRAAARAGTAASWAASCFRADWESACAFILGRTALEIGDCRQAEKQLERVQALAGVYGQTQAALRARIWTGRAASFAGDAHRARDILAAFPQDAEALWFLAELEAWEGSYRRAASLAEEALKKSKTLAFSPADHFDWSSGFASLEGRAVGFFARRSYLADQIAAFRDFSLGMSESDKEGLVCAARLSALAREDRLATIHPSAHLYLFYRYLILEKVTPSSMDGAGAISKAFKALQLRSTRMGEAYLKDGFLEANRWNRGLLNAARARKLI